MKDLKWVLVRNWKLNNEVCIMKKRNCLLLLGMFAFGVASGQLNRIGLIEKIPIGVYCSGIQEPKMHIWDDTLFVASTSGVYCKALPPDGEFPGGADEDFMLHSFSGLQVVDFVRSGVDMLAVTGGNESEDNRLYRSVDGGMAYEELDLPELSDGVPRYIYEIEQNPQNPSTLMLLASDGTFMSVDFGDTWKRLEHAPEAWDGYLFYHPSDTTLMYMCRTSPTYTGVIHRTTDMWETYSTYSTETSGNMFDMAFHPEEPDVMFYCGAEIGKSVDKGETWECKVDLKSSCKFIFFNESCPDTLYAVRDDFNTDSYVFHMSVDGGETWELSCRIGNGGNDSEGYIADMVQYDGRLIIYTHELGILEVDPCALPFVNVNPLLGEYDVEETVLSPYSGEQYTDKSVLKLEENYEPGYNLKFGYHSKIIKANTEDGIHFEFSQDIGDVYTPGIYMSGDGRVEGDSIFMSFFVVNPYIESYNDTTLFECKGKRKTSSVASQPVRENGFDVYFASDGHTLSVAGATGEDRLSLTLTDMCGRCVLPETRLSGNSVPVPDLPRGVYLYVLSSDGRKVASGKIARR